ncbi:MAG: hypothetical protein J5960_01445 [Desulfovibrio sp.]|nr:hypothetical protein [Desulfovibrio sp.]
MTNQEFEDAVRLMRRCQREFHKSRAWTASRYARDWEQRVDAELKRREASRMPQQGESDERH